MLQYRKLHEFFKWGNFMGISEDNLIDLLEKYSNSDMIPMHMPGHKRNALIADYLNKIGAKYDITEIDGFDNLHEPCEILKSSMNRAAKLWKSRKSFYLVNGSTCGILAGVHSIIKSGDKVLVARNCHKSVYNALELCGANPILITPPIDVKSGIYASVSPEAIENMLNKYSDIKLVIITSPTYEGVISDIKNICDISHEKNIPVMVDEAHGAHLGFGEYFNGGAVEAGADLVIQSLHKTMPCLTQTAIAHINGTILEEMKFSASLDIFETSSPSYLLMASIDGCVRLIEQKGDELFDLWQKALENFTGKMKNLRFLSVLFYGNDDANNHENIYKFDRSKIVILTKNTKLTGLALMRLLREKYKIELEMSSVGFAIAMTGLGDTFKSIDILANALLEIDKSCEKKKEASEAVVLPEFFEKTYEIKEALLLPYEFVDSAKAINKVSAEYIWAYPPGVPIIVPGEIINQTFLDYVRNGYDNGVSFKSTYKHDEGTFAVVR